MNLFEWLESGIKNMKWYDVSFIKFSVFFSTLFLMSVWPAFREFVLSIHWQWHLLIALVFSALVLKKMFSK